MALTERQIAIIEFERISWQLDSSKEKAIREQFSISPSRYYKIRDELIDIPAAMDFDPMVVKRLQKQRKARRSSQFGISVTKSPIR